MHWVHIVFLTMLVFFVIVTIHEWGHFFFAKQAGILVREFAIGFGPKIYSYTRRETMYTLRLLPLGGSVRMAGEEPETVEINPGQVIAVQVSNDQVTKLYVDQLDMHEQAIRGEVKDIDLKHNLKLTLGVGGEQATYDVHPQAKIIVKGSKIQIAPQDRQFGSKTVGQRAMTIFGGALMNFVLAFILFGAYIIQVGIPVNVQVKDVSRGMPAEKANLQKGDIIEQIDNVEIGTDKKKLLMLIAKSKGAPMDWKVHRGGQRFDVTIIPVSGVQGVKVGANFTEKRRIASFIEVFEYAAKYIRDNTSSILKGFQKLFFNQFTIEELGGPVRMFKFTGQVAMQGIESLMLWAAMLSLYLGIFNLLPIPALDGGRLVFLFVEIIRGKRIDPYKEGIVHFVGFAMLMLLMVAVTYHDILRLVNK